MERRGGSNAGLVGLAIMIVALIVVAIVAREWWLLAVAAGCSAVLFSQRGERQEESRPDS